MRRLKINSNTNKESGLSSRVFFMILIGVFVAIQVFFTVQTVTSGARLSELEMEVSSLSKKNKVLTEKILEKSSLSKLEETVESHGFTKADAVVYVQEETFAARIQ